MTIFATAGAKLYIGSQINVTDDLNEASFTGQTWTEIKPMESLGSLGDASNPVEFTDISKGRTSRLRGSRSAPTLETIAGIDYEDAGQVAVYAAEGTNFDFAFKIEFDDAPIGGTPSERKFGAMVGSVLEVLDTADNVMKLNMSLWVNSNVVRLNAAGA